MSDRRTKIIAALVVLVAFFGGVIAGFVADRVMLWRFGPRPLPERAPHFLVGRLDRHLDLTAEQRETIERIVEERHQRIAALRAGLRPRIQDELEAANVEIAAVLTPEQRVKFERMKMRLLGPPPHERERGHPRGRH